MLNNRQHFSISTHFWGHIVHYAYPSWGTQGGGGGEGGHHTHEVVFFLFSLLSIFYSILDVVTIPFWEWCNDTMKLCHLNIKPRPSLCTHAFHCTDSTDPDTHVPDGWMLAVKQTQHAPSTKMECDYLHGWIKMQTSHPKWWTPEM